MDYSYVGINTLNAAPLCHCHEDAIVIFVPATERWGAIDPLLPLIHGSLGPLSQSIQFFNQAILLNQTQTVPPLSWRLVARVGECHYGI